MHYRNGREAKNGDKLVSLGMDGSKIVAVGILTVTVASRRSRLLL